MKNYTKLILVLVITLIGVTQYYRQNTNIPAANVHPRRQLLDSNKLIGVTGQTRTSNVQNYCTKPRDQLVTTDEINTANSYFNTLKIYFNSDPYLLTFI
jgi:hypothetical protein